MAADMVWNQGLLPWLHQGDRWATLWFAWLLARKLVFNMNVLTVFLCREPQYAVEVMLRLRDSLERQSSDTSASVHGNRVTAVVVPPLFTEELALGLLV